MTLTLGSCGSFVRLTLGGESSAELPLSFIVNESGKHLYRMARWRFNVRSSTLDLVASQSYIDLPADFSEIMGLVPVTGNYVGAQGTTFDELLALRNPSMTSNNGFGYYAISYRTGDGVARMEISHTPTAAVSGAYNIFYRAGWTDLTEDTDRIPIPSWAELLFTRIVQAVARGFEEEDQGSLDARLMEIQAGPVFRSALSEDRSKQTDFGHITMQTVGPIRGEWCWPFVVTGP